MPSVPGGSDLERKNQYWIDLGVARERQRITALAKDKVCFDHRRTGYCDHTECFEISSLIVLIKGEN